MLRKNRLDSMIGKPFGPFWTSKASQERAKGLPKAAKMRPKTRKK